MPPIGLTTLGRSGDARPGSGNAALAPSAETTEPARGGSNHGPARSGWAQAARWWFEALEGRLLGAPGHGWVAQVVGIHEVRPHLWIQLESQGDPLLRLVLHVTLETCLDDALAAMAGCGAALDGPQVIDGHAWRFAR